MIALLQRVSQASVEVADQTVAEIAHGLLVLVAAERHDTAAQARRLAERLLAYRVFADDKGRMNLDVRAVEGSLLLVPQFTLAADTRHGNRPGFSLAAEPLLARSLFDELVHTVSQQYPRVETGRFGADMAVRLVNQGPVTFWLQVTPDTPAPAC